MTELPPASPPPAKVQANAAPGVAAPEEVLWQGRCSPRTFWPEWFAWLAMFIVAIILLTLYVSGDSSGTWWMVTLGLLGAGLVIRLINHFVQYFSRGYKLTTQAVFLEKGIFHKIYDHTDMLRIVDVRVKQSFRQRLLGVGSVVLISEADKTDPEIYIKDIEKPHEIAEKARIHIRKRRENRTLFMENV